jgi:hypothetical protein
MQSRLGKNLLISALVLAGSGLACEPPPDEDPVEETTQLAVSNPFTASDDFGTMQVFSTTGSIDTNNPFFKSLGANGRTCNSCHKLEDSMGISGKRINSIFTASSGQDPIFRINDGSNAPTGFYARIGTLSDRKISFSMLLNHGVIRVGQPIPSSRDYSLAAVQDPYFFASASELSLFRRPMPSVNLAFSTHVMWDGRESEGGRTVVRDALLNQANDATTGHAQRATAIDSATRAKIADFQLRLFSAQSKSKLVGALDVAGCSVNDSGEDCLQARGNAVNLSLVLTQGSPGGEQGAFGPFKIGINDPLAVGFKNISLTPFNPWDDDELPEADTSTLTNNRRDIGVGEKIFYTKPIVITGVAGLNDSSRPVVNGFCTTCHNTPDVGTHSRPRLFDTGVADASGANPLFTSDFPIYTFRRNSDGNQRSVTDPGLALRTGKFADLGRFKVPSLRGLGARAPYFHNGSAKTLTDVVNFYNRRFNIGFTAEEIRQVVLFLQQT